MSSSGESEPTAPAEAKEAPAADAKPAAAPASGALKRGAALRRELLGKLPRLEVAGDRAGALSVEPNAVDLDADAFIGPLAALVSEGRG